MNKCEKCKYSYEPEGLPDKGCLLQDVPPCSWPDVLELDANHQVFADVCERTTCDECDFYDGEDCMVRSMVSCHDKD